MPQVPTALEVLADVRSRGFSKTTRFSMLIPTPSSMLYDKNAVSSELWSTFSIESTQMPGYRVDTIDNIIHHISRKMPYMVGYDEVQMLVRCDASYAERRFFESWKNLIINPATGDVRYKQDYSVNVLIEQKDDVGNTIFGCMLINAYPIMVGDMDFSSQNADIQKCSVSITFDRYVTYDDLQIIESFNLLDFKGDAEFISYQGHEQSTFSGPAGDSEFQNYQGRELPAASTPRGQKEYEDYQSRGIGPMAVIRHLMNAHNYADPRKALESLANSFGGR